METPTKLNMVIEEENSKRDDENTSTDNKGISKRLLLVVANAFDFDENCVIL